jgi:hypothetical protein
VEKLDANVNHGHGQRGIRTQSQTKFIQVFTHALQLLFGEVEKGLE